MDYNFRFNVGLWRNATLPPDYTPPADAELVLTLDESWTSEPHSDESAFVVTHRWNEGERGGIVLMHSTSERWKGMLLCDAALSLIADYRPAKFEIEKIPASDLFVDALHERAEKKGLLVPRIVLITPRNTRAAKASRIMRLNDLLTSPGVSDMGESSVIPTTALQIVAGHHTQKLFAEVEAWTPKQGNNGRQDNLLDSLALAAGFR